MDKFTDWHLYIGCPCRINGVGNYTLDGVWNGSLYLRDKGRVSKVFFDEVGCVKLVLRRLESMTKEERDSHTMWLDFVPDAAEGSLYIDRKFLFGKIYNGADTVWIDLYYVSQLVNALRKDGFDCDQLIERGQAIDQATLNQKS